MKAFFLCFALLALTGAAWQTSRQQPQPSDELKVKKLSVQEFELTDENGKVFIKAKVNNGTVVLNVGASQTARIVVAANDKFATIQVQNSGQVRAYLATDVRPNPEGAPEPGVTELCFFAPQRDKDTIAVQKDSNGNVIMKEVLGFEVHDGFSPGNNEKKKPETWVGMRMTNGVLAGATNSPVFEAFAIPPWAPMESSLNQPYLKAGRSDILFWGKDQPLRIGLLDGNLGDKVLSETTIDGKTSPARFGTTTLELNPSK